MKVSGMRTCDGSDPELIQYTDGYGEPVADPELAVAVGWCGCGSQFDERYHEFTWPHHYKQPARVEQVISDIPDLFGMF